MKAALRSDSHSASVVCHVVFPQSLRGSRSDDALASLPARVRQLQRKSRELRDMIETIPAMAWTARPDGSDPFVNRRWAEFTGLSAEARLLQAGRTLFTRKIVRLMRMSGAHLLLPASRSNPRRAFVVSTANIAGCWLGRAFSRCARKNRQLVWTSHRHRRPQACRRRAREAS